MEERRDTKAACPGYCLAELLVVLSLLGIALAIGTIFIVQGLERQQARGMAQSAQAATAWAQVGVLWQGGEAEVSLGGGELVVAHDRGRCGGRLGIITLAGTTSANVFRWRRPDGVALSVLGPFGSPDSGGSLYFVGGGGEYRLTVRPESGLTARSWIAE